MSNQRDFVDFWVQRVVFKKSLIKYGEKGRKQQETKFDPLHRFLACVFVFMWLKCVAGCEYGTVSIVLWKNNMDNFRVL